jgi:hypothetical protein
MTDMCNKRFLRFKNRWNFMRAEEKNNQTGLVFVEIDPSILYKFEMSSSATENEEKEISG